MNWVVHLKTIGITQIGPHFYQLLDRAWIQLVIQQYQTIMVNFEVSPHEMTLH